jgi:hypothetical protein
MDSLPRTAPSDDQVGFPFSEGNGYIIEDFYPVKDFDQIFDFDHQASINWVNTRSASRIRMLLYTTPRTGPADLKGSAWTVTVNAN